MSDERRKQRSTDELPPGEAHLSRLYEQTKEELPSAHLDAVVLESARRAAQPTARRVSFLPSRKWTVLLSLAAALLVVIGMTEFSPRPYHRGVDLVQCESKQVGVQSDQNETGRERGIGAYLEDPKKLDAPQPAAASAAPERRDVQPSLIPTTPSAPAEQAESDAPVAAKTVSPLAKERGISRLSETQGVSAALEQKSAGQVAALKAERLSPEEWIKQINELRRAKKLTEAEASLKKFKERYPEYPVDKFLK